MGRRKRARPALDRPGAALDVSDGRIEDATGEQPDADQVASPAGVASLTDAGSRTDAGLHVRPWPPAPLEAHAVEDDSTIRAGDASSRDPASRNEASRVQGGRSASDPALAAVLDAAASTAAGDDSGSSLLNIVKVTGGQADPSSLLTPDHPEFQCIIRQSVLRDVRTHAEDEPAVEVCGVLIGTVYSPRQPPLAYVDGIIRGESSASRSTQVTFTAQTWQHIHRVLEEEHPGKQIIGWYHTHPGFGVFLSEMDLFIQRNFFNAPWHVALVFDPKSLETGLFGWRRADVRRVDVVIDDGSAHPASPSFPTLPNLSDPSGNGPTDQPSQGLTRHPASGGVSDGGGTGAPILAASVADLADRVRTLETRWRWLLVAFAIALLVAIIWPLVAITMLPDALMQSPGRPNPPPTSNSNSGSGSSPLVPFQSK